MRLTTKHDVTSTISDCIYGVKSIQEQGHRHTAESHFNISLVAVKAVVDMQNVNLTSTKSY